MKKLIEIRRLIIFLFGMLMAGYLGYIAGIKATANQSQAYEFFIQAEFSALNLLTLKKDLEKEELLPVYEQILCRNLTSFFNLKDQQKGLQDPYFDFSDLKILEPRFLTSKRYVRTYLDETQVNSSCSYSRLFEEQ